MAYPTIAQQYPVTRQDEKVVLPFFVERLNDKKSVTVSNTWFTSWLIALGREGLLKPNIDLVIDWDPQRKFWTIQGVRSGTV
jgi:hypothetical protein